MEKIILHCDLNNFFASVEMLDHPELKDYPVAVCGNVDERRGIILAKNEIAKKYGVKTAEANWQAKQKCPDIVFLSPNMDKYIKFSKKAREIYENYTDLIEPFGIDEAWLDVSGSTLLFGNGYEIAYKIKEQIKAELGLTISVGVSFNKIFAKLGSDMKKPDAIIEITKENFKEKVWGLEASDLLGVGKATYSKLSKYGITTIGALAKTDKDFLVDKLGKNGEALWFFANGLGSTEVSHNDSFTLPKSVGNSVTCPHDLENCDQVWSVFYQLCESVAKRLRNQGLLAGAIQILVKDNTLCSKEFQAPLPFNTRHPQKICENAMAIFNTNFKWDNNVRSLGVRAINLVADDEAVQYSFMYDQNKLTELESLEEKVNLLRDRYGNLAVQRASLMNTNKTIKENKYDQTSLPKNFFKG